jgi:hypothetical protein
VHPAAQVRFKSAAPRLERLEILRANNASHNYRVKVIRGWEGGLAPAAQVAFKSAGPPNSEGKPTLPTCYFFSVRSALTLSVAQTEWAASARRISPIQSISVRSDAR